MSKSNHKVHKYIRVNVTKTWVIYKCCLPNCPHFVPVKLVIGRDCICYRCGNVFTMTNHTSTLKRPHCKDCTGKDIMQRKPYEELNDLQNLTALETK